MDISIFAEEQAMTINTKNGILHLDVRNVPIMKISVFRIGWVYGYVPDENGCNCGWSM